MLSGVKNAEHTPLWDFPEKDILPEEIQSSLGTSYDAKPDTWNGKNRHTTHLEPSMRATFNRRAVLIWKKYEGAAQE